MDIDFDDIDALQLDLDLEETIGQPSSAVQVLKRPAAPWLRPAPGKHWAPAGS